MFDELLVYSDSVKLMQDIPTVKEDLYSLKSDRDFTKFIEIVTN